MIEVDVVEGRGDPYAYGLKQGEAMKKTALFNKHTKRRRKSIRKYTTDLTEAKSYIKAFSPYLIDEIEGLADGLGWRTEDVYHEYAGYQQSWKKSGCSAIMSGGIYARNYDYHPKTYDGRFLLWQPVKGYAHIGFAQRMIGRMDGMNEKGLATGYHFVNRLRPEDGFICTSIARFILDSCATVKEAIALLKEVPHRHAFNYSLADRHGDRALVEGSSLGVTVFESEKGACTNHFQTPSRQNENRYKISESKERLLRLQGFISQTPSRRDIFSFLNESVYGVGKSDYGNWSGTIHTALYDTKLLEVTAGVGLNALPVSISFSDWLKGERLRIKKIRGKVTGVDGINHLK
ncbi:C45 family autoproteolytic acyltransferase/hydolase [Salipaludibacillus aurantiacus]|uniref:Predicted choloylglycine hydrolase n=1 Tax=Salipaludibacillus aurantiacus TaxID=1601833 RepID=A0A1H9VTF8_9BACI|nr:C45 family peptidase [Salipaludibacillus aurantiacus]SES24808.1 Predicted choloylglycine hydrolase [Salipaludibacillus aurantiacus]